MTPKTRPSKQLTPSKLPFVAPEGALTAARGRPPVADDAVWLAYRSKFGRFATSRA
jgi:hypothetical protein